MFLNAQISNLSCKPASLKSTLFDLFNYVFNYELNHVKSPWGLCEHNAVCKDVIFYINKLLFGGWMNLY